MNRKLSWMLAAVLLLGGCKTTGLIDPIVVHEVDACQPGTMQSGKGCAEGLRQKYLEAVSAREILNTSINASLLALVTAFGVLGVLDGLGTKSLLAGGVGGAALLAAPRVFGSEQRDFTYLAGAESMSCVLEAAGPALRMREDKNFVKDVRQARNDVLASIERLSELAPGVKFEERPLVLQMLSDLDEAYRESGRTLRALENSDERVLGVARSIDTKVNIALVQQRTDPLTLARSLGATAGLVQSSITQLSQSTLTAGGSQKLTSAPTVEKAMAIAARRRAVLASHVEEIQSAMTPFDDSSFRTRCTLDAQELASLSVQPTRLIFGPADGTKMRTAIVVVRGGGAGHNAEIIDVQPAEEGLLTVSVVDTREGFARIKIIAGPALEGDFTLLVRDPSERQLKVPIFVGAAASTTTNNSAGSNNPSASNRSLPPERRDRADVRALQSTLTGVTTCTLKPGLPSNVPALQKKLDPMGVDGKIGFSEKEATGQRKQSNTHKAIANLVTIPGSAGTPPRNGTTSREISRCGSRRLRLMRMS